MGGGGGCLPGFQRGGCGGCAVAGVRFGVGGGAGPGLVEVDGDGETFPEGGVADGCHDVLRGGVVVQMVD
jgi:hypothetical protein